MRLFHLAQFRVVLFYLMGLLILSMCLLMYRSTGQSLLPLSYASFSFALVFCADGLLLYFSRDAARYLSISAAEMADYQLACISILPIDILAFFLFFCMGAASLMR